jgi:hypothetical protein
VGAPAGAAEELPHLGREAAGDREADELVVVRLDDAAHLVGVRLHDGTGRGDDERGRVHDEVDHHVVDGDGPLVLREEEAGRLLVPHRPAQEGGSVLVAVGPDAVDALVQRLGVDAVEVVELRVVPHPSELGGRAPLGPNVSTTESAPKRRR